MSNEPKTTSSSDEDISSATSVGSDYVNIPTPTSGHFEIVIPHAETRERLQHQKTLENRLHDAEYELIAYKTELATAYAKIKTLESEVRRLRELGPDGQALKAAGPSDKALKVLGSPSQALGPSNKALKVLGLTSEALGLEQHALHSRQASEQALGLDQKALDSRQALEQASESGQASGTPDQASGPSSQALGPSDQALKAQLLAKDLLIQSITLKLETLKAQARKPDALRELNRLITQQNQELQDRLDSAQKGINETLEEKIRENLILKSDLAATNQQIDMIYEQNEREKDVLKQEHAVVVADKDREIEELNATIQLMKQW
ncbi:hypothetical protein CAEBREN_20744 [Caenorhabditis brenneri]|uniref:Uncharacterized protein n=1 Tax=Caenorhabditis brenneri TaxID=135651 RepID=G0PB69_CAEBE|nr:hypothetical protein CAEBREN_20744 [Caenorhabditis brenneri]